MMGIECVICRGKGEEIILDPDFVAKLDGLFRLVIEVKPHWEIGEMDLAAEYSDDFAYGKDTKTTRYNFFLGFFIKIFRK